MDHFGIGAAMEGMVRAYFTGARRTGRTTSLVESVKTGDRIVFANRNEAERVRRLCLSRGVQVQCIVIPPNDPDRLYSIGRSEGRTIFDHTWVEIFYELAIHCSQGRIDHLERSLSGHGVDHQETRFRAQELQKWEWKGCD